MAWFSDYRQKKDRAQTGANGFRISWRRKKTKKSEKNSCLWRDLLINVKIGPQSLAFRHGV